jgi:PleD family two-component response regulator
MPNLELPLLVVDDAKFSSHVITKTLRNAGYRDLRSANSASTALKLLEERPVSILIADWLMPEMDGLELAARVRQLDEQLNHYTYIILLTAREGVEALAEAFDKGVDDFIYKSDMNKQLLPRIYAADRIADIQNSLLMANQLLMDNNRKLESKNLVDLDTGLGNSRFASEQLQKALMHTEARGGASTYLLIGIKNWHLIKTNYHPNVLEEIAVGIARRLRHLTRPLDAISRIAENQFAVVMNFENVDHCTSSCFRRIHDGISLKAFKTSASFISVHTGTSVCAIENNEHMPSASEIEEVSLKNLQYSYETGSISLTRWTSEAQKAKS